MKSKRVIATLTSIFVVLSSLLPTMVLGDSYLPGDLNGDGKVNMTDVVVYVRHLSGEFSQEINELAADVNNDQLQDETDVDLIRKSVVGGYNVTLLPSKAPCEHEPKAVPAKEATCTENGNTAYWYCDKCEEYFSDADATTVILQEHTVIDATGHTPVVDEAVPPTYNSTGLTEGKHCLTCGETIVKQEIIPALTKNEYSITYYMYANDDYLKSIEIDNPNPDVYSKEEGLVLQDLHVDGYNFLGWFTAQSGGTQITEYAIGTTGNKTLYAHWEKVEYKVQFACDMDPQEDMTFTTGEERVLPIPEMDKYTFVGWCDKDGNMWEAIPKGTARNVTLYANWSSNRNKAVAKASLGEPMIFEDTEAGLILFTYEIGEIQNVPLFTTLNLQCANGIITTVSQTGTEEISSESASTIAKTVSSATTGSSSWTLENNWNKTTEVSQSYLDQTGQTREEAESLAKSESGTYNLTSSNGGSSNTTNNQSGSFNLSYNSGHSKTDTTETSQKFDLSVDAKFSNETSIGASIPLDVVSLDVGNKTSFELGAGVDYGNSITNTHSGTDSWGNSLDVSQERSKTTVDEKKWNTTSGYENSKTTSSNTSVANAVSKLISQEYGYGSSYAEGGSNSSTQELATTDSQSDEYSSTLTYHTSKIVSTTKEFQTTGNTMGGYRMVMAGKIHVFAVVGYDVAERSYFVYTYNVLDDTTEEYLDFSRDHSFNDYETSIIPFEIPSFVNDYVNERTAKTSGLQIDPDTGIIMDYFPDEENPDTIVIIPSYMSVDNGDGTYTSVKVKGIAEGLFKNNTNLKGVKLGNFITEIPDSAFEGCTNLKYVVAPGVTNIGNNAFKGCTSLEGFTVPAEVTKVGTNAFNGATGVNAVAANADVAKAVASSGAENIVLDISNVTEADLNLEVGKITSFELQGKAKEYSGLSLKSDAKTTVVNGVTFKDCASTPMEFSSENATLNRVTATAPGYALIMSADNTTLALNQTVSLTSSSENAVICKDVTLKPLTTSVVGKLNLAGNMLVAGTVTNEKYITFTSGTIVYITDEEFENKRSSCTITFDANGGTLTTNTLDVAYGNAAGTLPTPTYGDYSLVGWYTEKNGGTKVTADTPIASSMTLYAKWNNWDGTSTEPEYDAETKTYTITNGKELAWIAGVTNATVTDGINFPTDITFSGYTIELANNIYLNDTSNYTNWSSSAPANIWKPIGNSSSKVFSGNFDGNGNAVHGIYINDGTISYAGLFGSTSNAWISDVTMTEGYIFGYRYIGGIVGSAENTDIYCCTNHINISNNSYCAGGIAGKVEGNSLIKDCINYGNVYNKSSWSGGGIVGEYEGDDYIKYCVNYGNISGSNVGGITGSYRGIDIEYCENYGAISATSGVAGGICGDFNGNGGYNIDYCSNKGDVTGASRAGGIAGVAEGEADIRYCYNQGRIEANQSKANVGGIVGLHYAKMLGGEGGIVKNCHNTGVVEGDSTAFSGGIVGRAESTLISKCYSRASIYGSDAYTGSIIGVGIAVADDAEPIELEYCYGNKTTLYNIEADDGRWAIESVSYLSSTSLKKLSNLTGFSTSVWATDSSINNGYPYLIELKDTY